MPRNILILCAVEMEARALARTLGLGSTDKLLNWQGPTCTLKVIGIKAQFLAPALGHDAIRHGGIILAGLAGGLDPSLKIGDVLIDEQSNPLPAAAPPLRVGKIHTANSVMSEVHQKREAHQATGALAVDMENAVVRDAARSAAIPFLGIRAISDRADQRLDPVVMSLVDATGRPRMVKIAATLLRYPRVIPHLRTLEHQSTRALLHLGQAVKALLHSGWPEAAGDTVATKEPGAA